MNKNIINYLLLSLAGLASFVISLIKYIISFEIYSDSYGTDISFNNDYVVAIMISLCVLIYGLYMLLSKEKTNIYPYVGLCATSLLSFYPLGVFFKALNKTESAQQLKQAFNSNVNYLYIGIVGFFLVLYFGYLTILLFKKTK